ncbi:MAG: response regulator transcription factor [Myxococcales bacterium]|nr:response regulator transcription factor [Myxococcota bacterium]MDW8282196.1 response regulator transcription factor [Myxococcales bacterium]
MSERERTRSSLSEAAETPVRRQRILVVEDEPDIVRGLRDALEFEGYEVVDHAEGHKAVREMKERGADVVILDLMLPDINGYQVCEEIRAFNQLVPIIILSARGQELDKIRGLSAGADDYVTKPFSIGELLARIQAILRRLGRSAASHTEVIRIGNCEVNLKKHTLSRARKTIPLTFYEVELLKLLHERAEQPVSRDEILDKIWGIQAHPSNRTVDNFVVKLRKKLEENQHHPKHILTVYGYGYKLVP